MLQHRSPAARRLLSILAPQASPGFRNGGLVQGPGTATSDSVQAKLSDGEFVLPADTVRKVGVKNLRDLVKRTHAPSGQVRRPGRFADGGMPDDELRRQQNSFGDAAAAAGNADVQQLAPSPAAAPASPSNIFPGNRLPAYTGGISSGQVETTDPAPASAAQVGQRENLINQIPTDSYPDGPKPDGSQNNPLNTETGRNLQAIANAAGGLGRTVPALAETGGAISAFLNRVGNAVSKAAPVVPGLGTAVTAVSGAAPVSGAQPDGLQQQTSDRWAQVRGYGAAPSPGPAPAPAPAPVATPAPQPGGYDSYQARPDLGYGPIGDRTTLTNEQAAIMNPAGRITATRGANGVMEFSGNDVRGQLSYNDASGKALPGGGINGKFSGFQVTPAGANVAMDDNGNYAFSTGSGSGARVAQSNAVAPGAAGTDAGALNNSPQAPAVMAGSAGQSAASGGQNPMAVRAPAQPSSPEVPQFNAPQALHSGNDWQRENQLRNLEVSASSITNNGGRFDARRSRINGLSPAQEAYLSALKADLAAQGQQPGIDAETNRTNAGLQREGMQQAGSTQREVMQQAGSNQREAMRTGIEQGKLTLQQVAAGYQNRTAQRIDTAQTELQNAKTPEEQSSARQRLLALMGKQDDAHWKPITLQGGTDAQGNKLESVFGALNERTGEMKRMSPQGAATAAYPEGTKVRGKDGRTYVVKDGRPVLAGG